MGLLHLSYSKFSIRVTKRRYAFKIESNECQLIEQPFDLELDANASNAVDGMETLLCYDSSFEYQWAMWTNKGLKSLYKTSKGYWKLLSEFDAQPRVPVKHLNVIRALIAKVTQNGQQRLDANLKLKLHD